MTQIVPLLRIYNDFARSIGGYWQEEDGMLLTYAAALEAEKPETLRGAYELTPIWITINVS